MVLPSLVMLTTDVGSTRWVDTNDTAQSIPGAWGPFRNYHWSGGGGFRIFVGEIWASQ